MSIFSRLRRVRAILTVGVTIRALAWGFVAGLTLVIGAAIVDHFVALSVSARTTLVMLSLVAGVLTTIEFVWRDRTVRSLERVALWIEEQHPSLAYTLMTAVETHNEDMEKMAETIERIVTGEKKLPPNLDWPSARLYHYMGLPIFLYTPLFVVSRVSGWSAHVIEQADNNRLIRPRARYIGAATRKWQPVDKR